MNVSFKTLILNADYKPLSYFPLSICDWKDSIKAVFLEKVNVVGVRIDIILLSSLHQQVMKILLLLMKHWTQKILLLLQHRFLKQNVQEEYFVTLQF